MPTRARAAPAARGGRVRRFTPRLRHWALTNSRQSVNATLIVLRVADLTAAPLAGGRASARRSGPVEPSAFKNTVRPKYSFKDGILPSLKTETQGAMPCCLERKKQKAADHSAAFGLRVAPQKKPDVAYLSSAFRLAVPPSATSTSNSVFLPLPTNGCQATTLCLPGGTSLISKDPSSFTTAK